MHYALNELMRACRRSGDIDEETLALWLGEEVMSGAPSDQPHHHDKRFDAFITPEDDDP